MTIQPPIRTLPGNLEPTPSSALGMPSAAELASLLSNAPHRLAATAVAPDQAGWLVFSAFAWVAAFLPWVLRSLWIYLTPRADGKPG